MTTQSGAHAIVEWADEMRFRHEAHVAKEVRMDFITYLWVPIVASAAAVWVLGAVIWMVMPHRKKEWRSVGDDERFQTTLRGFNLSPGYYMFPYCGGGEDMKSEKMQEMWKQGPVGTLHVWSGMRSMGACMGFSFIFNVVASTFVAYLAWNAFSNQASPNYLEVFQITATAAFMAYTFALIPGGIWFGKPIKSIMYDVVDGLVMGLVTGGVFGWLWPTIETTMNVDLGGAVTN